LAAGSTERLRVNSAGTLDLTSTAQLIHSIDASISAAGSTQGTATILAKTINIVTTVNSGTGVVLPSAVAGMIIYIRNSGANSLNVYPASNDAINSGATNAAFVQGIGSTLQFIAASVSQWYTVGATYA
jgi:hypothetical protein